MFLCLVSLILSTMPALAQSLAAALDAAIQPELASLEALYKHLHANPELSYQEERTAARIAQELRDAGFEVTTGVGGHGVVGVLRNGPGPTVMVRTDLDALPVVEKTGLPYASKVTTRDDAGKQVGVMHACGHDMHMTSFVGTARTLVKLKDRWSGTLVMIGQPAEERGGGALAMLRDGLYTRFPKPDYALALHASGNLEAGKIGYRHGPVLANVDTIDIAIRGVGGHGAWPHMTKDPIVIASQVVLALQTIVSRELNPLDTAVVTVGSIHGGSKHNIISDQVDLQLTVRSYSEELRQKILAAIERITVNIARAAGVPKDREPIIKIAEEEYTPATINTGSLVDRVAPVWRQFFGADKVVEVEPVMGGEDFSRYGMTPEKVPIFIFWLGTIDAARMERAKANGSLLPALHSPEYWPAIHPTIETGVKAMTVAVLELLKKP
jgi:hippurate hydrolase